MKDLNEIMNVVDSKRDIIANSIANAFYDGDSDLVESNLFYIKESIRNCEFFIFRNNNVMNSYIVSINALLKKIEDKLGYAVKFNYYNRGGIKYLKNPLQADVKGINNLIVKKLRKEYMSCKEMYLKLGITYSDFIKFYKNRG